MDDDIHSSEDHDDELHDHETVSPAAGTAVAGAFATADATSAGFTPAPSPKAAPGELDLIRAFVNTLDREAGRDALDTPAGVATWLAERGLPGGSSALGETDVTRIVAVREALRRLLLANNEGGPPDRDAVRALTAAGRRARLAPVFAEDGSARLIGVAGGLDAAIGHLLAIVIAAMQNGSWPRLKACRNDTCQWAFYDHSKNRSGTWCTMSVCGSQLKARAYRRRRKTAADRSAR